MSDLIHVEAAKLEQDAIVEMFEIDLQHLQLGIFRFASTNTGTRAVMFNGQEYPPTPIEASGFAWDGVGTMPRPSLSIASKDLYFLNLVVDADDLVGAPVRRIKTFRKYLDDGSNPGTGMSFPVDDFVIEKKSSQTRHHLSFELSMMLDQQGVQVPRLMVLRDTCVLRYRYWTNNQWRYKDVSCPYTGTRMFKNNGEETFEPTEDACGKRISDCQLRFGEDATLPRLAFPGVGRM